MSYTRKSFWRGAAERAIKTGAEALLSLMTVGTAVTAIDWPEAGAIAAGAMVYSLLVSVADPDRADTAVTTAKSTIRKGKHH